MSKNSLVVYYDMIEELEDFSDAQVGQILRAMVEYDKTGTLPKFTGSLKTAFKFLKTRIDRDKEKYQQIIEKRRMAGSIGGNQRVANQANASICNQMQANQADSVSDSVINNKASKKINILSNTHTRAYESYDEIFDNLGVSPGLKESYISFIRHCQANGHIVINDKLKDIIIRLDMAYGGDDVQKHISLQRAISGGYYDVSEGRM